ncbi:ERAD-associated protein [Malassezia brasiliensis]|uniref:ERAD-associated protein n=1 Tax=Malassezia brasiliensis TaxID=1821822 RepID=A0AAF0DYK4_9BASI|nr:ERAD-associated protein [Malassezia brasiliensis]
MQSIQEAHDTAPRTNALRTLVRRWMLSPSPTAPTCHVACQVRDYAVRLLEHLAFHAGPDAQAIAFDAAWVLGEHSLWGTHGATPNISRALQAYERLAMSGNASAHARLGFLYGSPVVHSLFGVPDDPARAVAHYAAAAKQGERHATLALAHRSLHGLGVRESCMRALHLYEHEAHSTYTQSQAVVGGRMPSYTKWPVHLLEQWEQRTRQMPHLLHLPPKSGIFWRYQRHHMVPKILEEHPRLVYDAEFRHELLQILEADPSEDLEQYLFLALALYHGSMVYQSESIAAVPRDFARSAELARLVVHHYWPVDLAQAPSKTLNEHDLSVVAEAAELLGMQYLRGEGVTKDEHRAALWFERSRRAYGEYGLGLLDLYGLAGHVRDPDAAQTHFANRTFITSAYPSARLEVAKYGLARGNFTLAREGLDTPLLSFGDHWYAVYPRVEQPYIEGLVAAEDLRHGNATCGVATRKFKEAAERGDWADPIYHRGTAAYARNDIPTALLAFALAAEQGMSSAQENVAYLLESRTPLALRFWAQSAVQKGEGALHMCDAQLASGSRQASIDCFGHLARRGIRVAYWRLGWLYETSLPPDFALAKRNYDSAMQDGPHTETLYAFLVYLRLGMRVVWHAARHCDPWLLWAFATA